MQLVDSHCHINFPSLSQQLQIVLQQARANDVSHMLCVAVNLEDFPQILELAHNFSHIFASVGVHPNEQDGQDPAIADLVRLAQDPKVIAIGETGLDYYRSTGDLSWQQMRFRRHIQAAKACAKPLIVHTRQAAEDTLRIMQEEGAAEIGGVMHCFSENWEIAQKALELNFYISFSGIVTFKNARTLQEVAVKIPADRLLIETDSPYLAPVPHRGQMNTPAYVRHVAEYIAQLRQVSLETIADTTTANFFKLFKHANA